MSDPAIDLRTEAGLEAELVRLLGFGTEPMHPAGGCGVLDEVGVVDTAQPSYLWITGRMLHVRSLAVLLDVGDAEQNRELVERILADLAGPLRDADHGGWFSGLTPDGEPVGEGAKSAYDHTFVVLGCSSAVRAGIDGAEDLLREAADVFDRHFWDEAAGMCLDGWDRAFTVPDDYRGANANMHAVEAMLALAELDPDGPWVDRAARITTRILAQAADHGWRVPEHFDAAWRPLLELNRDRPADPFKPYGATVGHGLEWARLALHLEVALGHTAPAALLESAVALFDRAVADGWAVDGAEGFVYTTDWSGTPVVRARMHWVVCEAIAAAVVLHRRTDEDGYATWAATWWTYVQRYLVDLEHGSLHHELDAENRPHAGTWAGKPDLYHAVQAALLPQLGPGSSIAGSLVRSLDPRCATRALVVGEALVDVVVRGGASTEHPGGSPANVALALGRLGDEATLVTDLGADARGERIRSWLADSGVAVLGTDRGATSTAVATLDASGAASYTFDLSWEPPVVVAADADVVHVGSIGAVLDPGAATVARLVASAHGTATISYDPNVRPALMGEADRASIAALIAHADVVKCSDEDAAWLHPGTALDAVARAWRERGPALVVITRGAAGALAVCAAGTVEIDAPPTAVADTVGAGDTFTAAMLHWLGRAGLLGALRRERLRRIDLDTLRVVLTRAADAAAVTVSRPGADPPYARELGKTHL